MMGERWSYLGLLLKLTCQKLQEGSLIVQSAVPNVGNIFLFTGQILLCYFPCTKSFDLLFISICLVSLML